MLLSGQRGAADWWRIGERFSLSLGERAGVRGKEAFEFPEFARSKRGSWKVSTPDDWPRIGTMNRERGALLRPDVETATRGAMLRAPTDRFMESGIMSGGVMVIHRSITPLLQFVVAPGAN